MKAFCALASRVGEASYERHEGDEKSDVHDVDLHSAHHFHVHVEREEWKLDTLCDLSEHLGLMPNGVIVRVNTPRKAEWLAEKMHTSGDSARDAHFKRALGIANAWRERLGLARDAAWDEVGATLAAS